MKLYELNQEVEILEFERMVEKYQEEYLNSPELMNEAILEEGIISWLSEKAELGMFYIKLLKDSTAMGNAAGLANKLNYSNMKNSVYVKIDEYTSTIDAFIQSITDNPTVLNLLEKIKAPLLSIRAMIARTYEAIVGIQTPVAKLAASIGFSAFLDGVLAKLNLFAYLKGFSKEKISEYATELVKKVSESEGIMGVITTLKDSVMGVIQQYNSPSAILDLPGLSAIVGAVTAVGNAVAYVYGILKAIKSKFDTYSNITAAPTTATAPAPA